MRMWLARLFGGRKVKEEDEPARFAPPAPPVQPVKNSSAVGSAKRGIHADKVASKVKSGFDPYNSGSFERQNAWERVIRR
jgi:hypothetical protein